MTKRLIQNRKYNEGTNSVRICGIYNFYTQLVNENLPQVPNGNGHRETIIQDTNAECASVQCRSLLALLVIPSEKRYTRC